MKLNFFLLVFLFLFCSVGPGAAVYIDTNSTPKFPDLAFNRYVGILHHLDIDRDQLAKLDFIPWINERGETQLIAILTLSFGDFKSHEYVSYHYENVSSDPDRHQLIFSQSDQAVVLVTTEITPEKIVADVHTVWSGKSGRLELLREGPTAPSHPLIEPLWGEYRGKCENGEETLQLNTFRSREDMSRIGQPFASYSIDGQVGVRFANGLNCGRENQPLCVSDVIQAGSYNFFSNYLNIDTLDGQLLCRPQKGGIRCGECFYSRISPEMNQPLLLSPSSTKPAFPSEAPRLPLRKEGRGLVHSGRYTGYLHHEFLDLYQHASLDLIVFPRRDGTISVSAMAKLAFGNPEGHEFIPYRFEDQRYPSPNPPVVVLKNKKDDLDAILVLTEISEGYVRGIWYSRLFGKVGTFELRQHGLPLLPPHASVMRSLSGWYETNGYKIELQVRESHSPSNTDNPFFPNIFAGDIIPDPGSRITLLSGSYDFYTGRIAFRFQSNRTFSGERTNDGMLYLNPSSEILLSPMSPHYYFPFHPVARPKKRVELRTFARRGSKNANPQRP